MKLLVINHLFPSKAQPSKGIFVLRQLERLTETGVDIRVLAPVPFVPDWLAKKSARWSAYHAVPKADVFGSIRVDYPRYLRPPGRWFRPFSGHSMYLAVRERVRQIHQEWTFDAILGNGLIPDGEAVVRSAGLCGVPGYVYAIGDDVLTFPGESARMLEKTRFVLRQADGVIAHGSGLAARLGTLGVTLPRLATLYRGVDLRAFAPDANRRRHQRQRLGLDDHHIACLFVGYLEPRKGIEELAAAFSHVLQTMPNVRLFLVGENLMTPFVENWLANSDAQDRVVLAGPVAPAELVDWYAAADVFVLPSRWEGTPNALVEAAAAGLPIVATAIPGTRDVLGAAYDPWLAKPADADSLQKQLLAVLASAETRKKLAEMALNRVRHRFDARENVHGLKAFLSGSTQFAAAEPSGGPD